MVPARQLGLKASSKKNGQRRISMDAALVITRRHGHPLLSLPPPSPSAGWPRRTDVPPLVAVERCCM
jgi:hypothetical protein